MREWDHLKLETCKEGTSDLKLKPLRRMFWLTSSDVSWITEPGHYGTGTQIMLCGVCFNTFD